MSKQKNGLRPVNVRTDLAPLADLIELAFADTMDSSGRAALREMRQMSRFGPGLAVISQLNDLALGIGMGYVWVEDGEIIGNVSIYPSGYPKDLPETYVIANVAVHPDYRRQGIARQLMLASMEHIAKCHAQAILQVEAHNTGAHTLYRTLGFVDERVWTQWRRTSYTQPPPLDPTLPEVYIRRRRKSEWEAEFQLARRIRPLDAGGLGWLRPLHPSEFKRSWWRRLIDWLSLRSVEHLVAVEDDQLIGSLWIHNSFGSSIRLTLLVEPDFQGMYDNILLHYAVKRFGRTPLVIEHPDDEHLTKMVLQQYRFHPERTVIHMHWSPPSSTC
ncbi:MAG: hypothetical protein CUN56_08020 [Phototrophicales bacterium]|nr:MAG: hypothetical protein CUN56_08020 [Phototrophicales bacterium]